ncbi:MAG: DUF4440 domain-containing protein [Phenylobacterium sp.]|uniref:DUF4440 domain-containing protein n=1 Tax=Phenylobacterium sp. TaxID=1871053 RepID=UPI001A38F486|nr:DUF4440 domain-containing protein [Phenylobacterium sp.]MBL8553909.1 DUF4440 domain-containing protein [Phenylobacterium sp.]
MPIGLIAALAMAAAPAPDPREVAVTEAVQRFFDAMAREDRAALAQVVLPGTLFTAVELAADGSPGTSRFSVEDFARNLRPGLDERMWSPRVSVRGDMLATLSTPYEFRLDGKTTHCGIDVFTLVKDRGAWKIASLAWTREPAACDELKARR